MNAYHKTHIRRQIMQALQWMEAKTYQVTRAETDENGAPTGQTVAVCTLYGVTYHPGRNMDALLLAIPGITLANAQAKRMYGLILSGEMPRAGDVIDGQRILEATDTVGGHHAETRGIGCGSHLTPGR